VSAAAHGREKGNFVAGTESGIPGGKFLVAGSDNGGAIFGEIRMAGGVKGKELLDGGAVRELKGILRLAGEFLETAEKEDLHTN
jgi:hypothetical protein